MPNSITFEKYFLFVLFGMIVVMSNFVPEKSEKKLKKVKKYLDKPEKIFYYKP